MNCSSKVILSLHQLQSNQFSRNIVLGLRYHQVIFSKFDPSSNYWMIQVLSFMTQWIFFEPAIKKIQWNTHDNRGVVNWVTWGVGMMKKCVQFNTFSLNTFGGSKIIWQFRGDIDLIFSLSLQWFCGIERCSKRNV